MFQAFAFQDQQILLPHSPPLVFHSHTKPCISSFSSHGAWSCRNFIVLAFHNSSGLWCLDRSADCPCSHWDAAFSTVTQFWLYRSSGMGKACRNRTWVLLHVKMPWLGEPRVAVPNKPAASRLSSRPSPPRLDGRWGLQDCRPCTPEEQCALLGQPLPSAPHQSPGDNISTHVSPCSGPCHFDATSP
jgi:hypothetical protein